MEHFGPAFLGRHDPGLPVCVARLWENLSSTVRAPKFAGRPIPVSSVSSKQVDHESGCHVTLSSKTLCCFQACWRVLGIRAKNTRQQKSRPVAWKTQNPVCQ